MVKYFLFHVEYLARFLVVPRSALFIRRCILVDVRNLPLYAPLFTVFPVDYAYHIHYLPVEGFGSVREEEFIRHHLSIIKPIYEAMKRM